MGVRPLLELCDHNHGLMDFILLYKHAVDYHCISFNAVFLLMVLTLYLRLKNTIVNTYSVL